VFEWVRGSMLRPYLELLDATEARVFSRSYADALATAYPPEEDGTTLFPFRRVFAVAQMG
jgi:trans-aconitate 2-methyltransferase